MSTLSETPRPTARAMSTTQSVFTDSRLRVVLLLDVRNGEEQRFLRAYDQLCDQVASVPGHLSDQLCQSIENPSQWLITSEWESAPPFLAWVDSEAHREMVKPLHGCVEDTRSLRFSILRETTAPGSSSGKGHLQDAPRVGDGMVRHALTFTVKPGSEETVAGILADYESPEPQVDETTRLCRTSLFMSGNRVVRAVEVKGDLVAALRHVARQPQVRAVEEAINPHLEVDRDLDDPDSAREFFMRAALPAVHHVTVGGAQPADPANVTRHALLYPVRGGCGPAAARLLARQDELAVEKPENTIVSSTIFQHEDVVVRLVDLATPLDERPEVTSGVGGARAAAVLGRLLDLGSSIDISNEAGLRRLLADCAMDPVTDRRAADR